MKYFTFRPDLYNFWPLYTCIRQYYPIGIKKDEAKAYYDFEGIKELNQLYTNNIQNTENSEYNWNQFIIDVQSKIGYEVVGNTFRGPSFSAYVSLPSDNSSTILHLKELHFSVSLLGPFYQIYGKDSSVILEEGKRVSLPHTNIITPSPSNGFSDIFLKIEQFLQERFQGYRMVPFVIGQSFIEGLQVVYSDSEECTINQALFNDHLSSCNTATIRKGHRYGMEQWKKNS